MNEEEDDYLFQLNIKPVEAGMDGRGGRIGTVTAPSVGCAVDGRKRSKNE